MGIVFSFLGGGEASKAFALFWGHQVGTSKYLQLANLGIHEQ
jgi:hypothetical protein